MTGTSAPTSVLITSAAAKVSLVESYRTALDNIQLEAQVWAGDLDPGCAARHFADEFWPMPRLDELEVDALIEFCGNNAIGLIVPTRDGELPYFAEHRETLAGAGITVMVAGASDIADCLDKLAFFTRCQKGGVPAIPTYASLAELRAEVADGSVVVKERFGAGSRTIGVDLDDEAAAAHALTLDAPIFQPYEGGSEYSVDLYVSRTGEPIDVVPRRRDRVQNGESVVTTTVELPGLVSASIALARLFCLRGHNVLQAFERDDEITFIECNPRYGGASALSFEAGLDSPYLSLLEHRGEAITPHLGEYRRDLQMIRVQSDAFFQL